MLHVKLTRAAARFELTDDDAETVVTITEQDDQEALLRKLKRVVALVEGAQAEPRLNVAKVGYMRPVSAERVADEDPPTNGWAKFVPPTVPAHLEGEVELVQPEEQA